MAKFVMLIGLPGVGKTTHTSKNQAFWETVIKLKPGFIVLSSDAIRKEVYCDETIQDDPQKIFDIMNKRAIESLKQGVDVIYDATNIRRKNRVHTLSQLPKCEKHALVMWSRFDTCVKRDSERRRSVGKEVIDRMIRRFQPPYYDEGWDEIGVIHLDSLYEVSDYDWNVDCEHDNPHHNNSVKDHTQKAFEAFCMREKDFGGDHGLSINIRMRLAIKLHDVGKRFVKSFVDSHGRETEIAHFYDHQNVSSYFTLGYFPLWLIFQGRKNIVKDALFVAWLVGAHMEPFFDSKYYHSLKGEMKRYLDVFHECDVEGA